MQGPALPGLDRGLLGSRTVADLLSSPSGRSSALTLPSAPVVTPGAGVDPAAGSPLGEASAGESPSPSAPALLTGARSLK